MKTCIGSWKLFLAHGYCARAGTRELWEFILGALRWTLIPLSAKHCSVAQREKIPWSLVTQNSLSPHAPFFRSHIDHSQRQPECAVVHHQLRSSCFILWLLRTRWWNNAICCFWIQSSCLSPIPPPFPLLLPPPLPSHLGKVGNVYPYPSQSSESC